MNHHTEQVPLSTVDPALKITPTPGAMQHPSGMGMQCGFGQGGMNTHAGVGQPIYVQQQPLLMQGQPQYIQQQPILLQGQPQYVQQQPLMGQPIIVSGTSGMHTGMHTGYNTGTTGYNTGMYDGTTLQDPSLVGTYDTSAMSKAERKALQDRMRIWRQHRRSENRMQTKLNKIKTMPDTRARSKLLTVEQEIQELEIELNNLKAERVGLNQILMEKDPAAAIY